MGLKRRSEYTHGSTSKRQCPQGSRRSLPIAIQDSSDEDDSTSLTPTRKPVRTQARQKRPLQNSRSIQKRAATVSKNDLAAELADLADYNKPPVPRSCRNRNSEEVESDSSESDSPPRNTVKADRRARHADPSREILPLKGSRSSKLKDELRQLEPWHEWVQELKRNPPPEDDSDDEEESPRHHSRHYPPKQHGVQNVPWSELSGELRNTIYNEVMKNEEKAIPTLTHYPNGLPRRTMRGFGTQLSENFPQSSWGFTQTSQQIQQELTPWLLSARRVRTRLATINEYIDTFHQRTGGLQQGWVEPFCCGVPLSAHGVEVLTLIRKNHSKGEFQLQLTPTPSRLALPETRATRGGPELEILRILDKNYARYSQDSLPKSGVQGIRIAPYIERYGRRTVRSSDVKDVFGRLREDDVLVKLDIKGNVSNGKSDDALFRHRRHLNAFIKQSLLALKRGLRIQAKLGEYIARWYIDCNGRTNTSWDWEGS
ncbi:hypothetical protein J1614_003282 [Plenodomus biglobosus]|nr:hypothetical protein J1614_003282 [Plenodomus biglobosus]